MIKLIYRLIREAIEMRQYDNYGGRCGTPGVFHTAYMLQRWHDWLMMPEEVKNSMRQLRKAGRPCSWHRIWDSERVGTGPPYEVAVGGKPSDSGGVTFR